MVFIFFCRPQIEGVIRKKDLKEIRRGNGEGVLGKGTAKAQALICEHMWVKVRPLWLE